MLTERRPDTSALMSTPHKVVVSPEELLDVSVATGQSINRPRRISSLGPAAFMILDALIVIGSGLFAYKSRAILGGLLHLRAIDIHQLPHLRLVGFLICYAIFTVICNASLALYSESGLNSARISRRKIVKAFCLSSLLTSMVLFLGDAKVVPRLMFGVTMLASMAAVLFSRYLKQRHNLKAIDRGIGTQHVLVVGSETIGQALHDYLARHRFLGKVFCGFVDTKRSPSAHWLGTPDDLPRIIREKFVDEIYFTPDACRDLVMDVALRARENRISVKVLPDLYGGLTLGAGFAYVGPIPVLELNHHQIPSVDLFLKRVMDLTVASTLILVSAPIMLLAAILIRLDSQGTVLYSAWRVGRKGRKFRCHKFRTMIAGADAQKHGLRGKNERNGATFKIVNDPRITRVGHILRKYSVDELPQLFNVLKGDMSIVGPRPHPLDDFQHYRIDDLRRLDVLPGITGLWQVSARRDPSFERNVLLDLEYIENWSVMLDVKIILRTITEVLRGSGS
jgi:exopolysaccharide biosynthesis polyprenyl glycosylphosphotransferase